MERVLISACLLGKPVRYDGGSKRRDDQILLRWKDEGRLVSCCPEVAGGLPVPRPPAEILAVDDEALMVRTRDGTDVTAAFLRGAAAALELARRYDVRVAVLKDDSPSCGTNRRYDGTFTGRTVPGAGVTARLLELHGIRVFSETALDEAAAYLQSLETSRTRQ